MYSHRACKTLSRLLTSFDDNCNNDKDLDHMLAHTMNEGSTNQESEGMMGLIKDEVDVDEIFSTFVPMQLQGEEVATAPKHHQEEGTELDPKIWSPLSEHLLENILAWLPLPSLFVLCTVCKQWNAFTYSPSFLAICARVPLPKQAWFLFRGDGEECVEFNPDIRKWHRLPVDQYLPARRMVASVGGLVCGRQQDDRLVVCNPMSKAWTVLPPKRHRWKYPIVGMVMDRESGGYMLVVAGSHNASGKSLTTEVYNSTMESWKLIGTRPFQYRFQTNAVHFHSSLYTAVAINLVDFHAILVYNLEQEQWMEVPGPVLAKHTQLMVPQICKCRGCLLLVEVVSERFLITCVSLCHPSDPWTNITSIPPPLLQEIVTLSGSRLLTYYGHGDLVLFTFVRQSVLAYNLAQSTWEWMPRRPFIRGFAQTCSHVRLLTSIVQLNGLHNWGEESG